MKFLQGKDQKDPKCRSLCPMKLGHSTLLVQECVYQLRISQNSDVEVLLCFIF